MCLSYSWPIPLSLSRTHIEPHNWDWGILVVKVNDVGVMFATILIMYVILLQLLCYCLHNRFGQNRFFQIRLKYLCVFFYLRFCYFSQKYLIRWCSRISDEFRRISYSNIFQRFYKKHRLTILIYSQMKLYRIGYTKSNWQHFYYA